MTKKPDRWKNTWAEQKKEELTSERSKSSQPENQAKPPAADRQPKEYGHGWDSTGTSDDKRDFRSCMTNAHNTIEGAKFQANKDTPKDRKTAHRQLDAAMRDLKDARRIVEEDRQERQSKTGNGFLDFLGLNFDNPSDNRGESKLKLEEAEVSTPKDARSDGKTGNGFLDFLGLNFDNPSNRQ